VCTRCASRYPADERRFNFLSGELREIAAITDTDNISALGYDDIAEGILRDCAGGLVLDNGSGAKGEYRDDVVYLEIADYESTDVLGVGESLPFADGTFDAVLSLAVLEHVRDPFRCSQEIVRVLKPGGIVYAAVPFLQPYHGYPSHYYNMSLQGLENLFEERCTIQHSGTPVYGLPIWTLCWFLSRYVDALPPKVARKFSKMKIRDFVRLGDEFLDRDFVQQLSAEATHDLACVNYVVATKN
jgi:SAM-dependent methyltransferase